MEPVSIGDGEFELSYDDWYWLYHWDVMGGDTADDDDFGKNPLDTILANKVARGELAVKDLAGKTEKELYALITFDEVFEEFMDELGFDPVKGAAVMGYYDVVFGTNFLGSSSTESMDHPDALMDLINEKAREWLKDQGAYYSALNSFIATLKRSDEAEIRYSDGGLDDQMYMWRNSGWSPQSHRDGIRRPLGLRLDVPEIYQGNDQEGSQLPYQLRFPAHERGQGSQRDGTAEPQESALYRRWRL